LEGGFSAVCSFIGGRGEVVGLLESADALLFVLVVWLDAFTFFGGGEAVGVLAPRALALALASISATVAVFLLFLSSCGGGGLLAAPDFLVIVGGVGLLLAAPLSLPAVVATVFLLFVSASVALSTLLLLSGADSCKVPGWLTVVDGLGTGACSSCVGSSFAGCDGVVGFFIFCFLAVPFHHGLFEVLTRPSFSLRAEVLEDWFPMSSNAANLCRSIILFL